jgi:hypothetical protein
MLVSVLNTYEKTLSTIHDFLYESYKGLTQNPQWLLMRKIARFKVVRDIVYFLFYSNKSEQLPISISNSLFADIDINHVVSSLKKDGVCLGIDLPQDIVEEIVDFAKYTLCYNNRRAEIGFYYHQKQQAQALAKKQFILAHYFNTGLLCPAIHKLQNDATLLAIAAKYLEREPAHQGNQLWWSFAGEKTYRERSRAAQLFHYDLDDYRFIKFFFYLTDVDEQSGPHVCVRGSHKRKNLSHLWLRKRETDESIIDYYGQDSLVTICGQAGLGFVEDGLCFHKGMVPTHKDRLILQIEFATTDYKMQHDIKESLR